MHARDRDAIGGEVDDDGADLPVGELAPHQTRCCVMTTSHIVLVRREPVAVAVLLELRAHQRHCAPGLGLRDADAEQPVTARCERQPALLHGVVAEVLDGTWGAVEDELRDDRRRDVGPAELLQHDRGLDVTETGAPVLLAHRDGKQAGALQGIPGLGGELLGLVPVCGHRRELAVGDLAGELAQ